MPHSQLDRKLAVRYSRRTERHIGKKEAATSPGQYSSADLEKMEAGRAPTGADGKPMELHHHDGTPDGPLDPMSRTDHRGGENYKNLSEILLLFLRWSAGHHA
jgi:hypothetical protein